MSRPKPKIDVVSFQNLSQRLSGSEGSFLFILINYKIVYLLFQIKAKLTHNQGKFLTKGKKILLKIFY
jgi:hypothetical protein